MIVDMTIRSPISALNFANQIHGGADIFLDYSIHKLLSGIKKNIPHLDSRIPITLEILVKIIDVLPLVCSDDHMTALFRAMFLLAFQAFMRT